MDELEHAGVLIPPPLIYLAFFIIGLFLNLIIPLPSISSSSLTSIGILLIFTSMAMIYVAASAFRREKTSIRPDRPSTKLINYGIYSYSRNPMYVSMTVAYIGFALFLGSVWALILAAGAFITISKYAIEKEEKYLKRTFGKKYEDYLTKTRRWI